MDLTPPLEKQHSDVVYIDYQYDQVRMFIIFVFLILSFSQWSLEFQ